MKEKTLCEWKTEEPKYVHIYKNSLPLSQGKYEAGEIAPYPVWVHEDKKVGWLIKLIRRFLN